MWAVIGGTGFDGMQGFEVEELLPRETPFGLASSGIKRVSIGGQPCLYVPRHGEGHKLLPGEVNSVANFYLMKSHGVTKVVTLSAVGSLRHGIKPGEVVIPNQFINRTLGRRGTFCGGGIVGHVTLDKPVWPQAEEWLRQHAEEVEPIIHFDKTYVCIEGPSFSTKAEAQMHRIFSWDIVGMTAFPEYALAREAGICYLPICFVSDYDCWSDDLEHVSIAQIKEAFARNRQFALNLLISILSADIPEDPRSREGHLANNLLSEVEGLAEEKRHLLTMLAR